MRLKLIGCALIGLSGLAQTQSPPRRPVFDTFEVATVKPTPPADYRGARLFRMPSAHQFTAKNYALRMLIGLAWNLPPRLVSGGADWIDDEHFDVLAATPGETKPSLDEQMSMLQKLISERFRLTFHREKKEFSIYALTVAKTGSKLKQSAPADDAPPLAITIFPAASGGIDHVRMPAHNATLAQLTELMQRVVFDRPVVDQTGLAGRYDFDLEWTPDETQFGGTLPQGPPDTPRPGVYEAIQQQLGLKLEATRGPVDALVIDHVERPIAN